jgi:hypothetical protein
MLIDDQDVISYTIYLDCLIDIVGCYIPAGANRITKSIDSNFFTIVNLLV